MLTRPLRFEAVTAVALTVLLVLAFLAFAIEAQRLLRKIETSWAAYEEAERHRYQLCRELARLFGLDGLFLRLQAQASGPLENEVVAALDILARYRRLPLVAEEDEALRELEGLLAFYTGGDLPGQPSAAAAEAIARAAGAIDTLGGIANARATSARDRIGRAVAQTSRYLGHGWLVIPGVLLVAGAWLLFVGRRLAGARRTLAAMEADLAHRRLVEEEHTAALLKYRLLVRVLGEVTYQRRPLRREILWSGDYTRLLGWEREAMGSDEASWALRVHPDDLARVGAEFERAAHENQRIDVEYRFRHADGGYRRVHDRGAMVRDDAGRIVEVIGVLKEVEERARAAAGSAM